MIDLVVLSAFAAAATGALVLQKRQKCEPEGSRAKVRRPPQPFEFPPSSSPALARALTSECCQAASWISARRTHIIKRSEAAARRTESFSGKSLQKRSSSMGSINGRFTDSSEEEELENKIRLRSHGLTSRLKPRDILGGADDDRARRRTFDQPLEAAFVVKIPVPDEALAAFPLIGKPGPLPAFVAASDAASTPRR